MLTQRTGIAFVVVFFWQTCGRCLAVEPSALINDSLAAFLLLLVRLLSSTNMDCCVNSSFFYTGHSDSDGDTIVSPTFAAEPTEHVGVYTEKPVLTSKWSLPMSCWLKGERFQGVLTVFDCCLF